MAYPSRFDVNNWHDIWRLALPRWGRRDALCFPSRTDRLDLGLATRRVAAIPPQAPLAGGVAASIGCRGRRGYRAQAAGRRAPVDSDAARARGSDEENGAPRAAVVPSLGSGAMEKP